LAGPRLRRSRQPRQSPCVIPKSAGGSAAMCGPARGEHIARVRRARMSRIVPVRNPMRVASLALASGHEARGARREPIDTLGRRPWVEVLRQECRGCGASVREEAGRNPGRGFREWTLEGGNPREHPAAGVLIPRMAARGFRKGESPGAAVRGAGRSAQVGWQNLGRNGRWGHRRGNTAIPFGRRKLRRVNPRSAAGAKQNRRGIEGSKPSRG